MSTKLLEKLKDHLALVDRLAYRRFSDPVLADEAVVYALAKLHQENGKRLAGFSGRSKFSTYVGAVVRRLFEDFSRSKFGRLRPPAWISRLGGWWLQLYRLLCMERLSLTDALATFENYENIGEFDVEDAASQILSEIVDCGKHRGDEQLTADGELGYVADDGMGQGQVEKLENKERDILFAVIFQELVGKDTPTEHVKGSFHKILDVNFDISNEERLLLKLCFQDNLSVSQAARLLDVSVHKAHGMMRRLLQRLKENLRDAGLADELLLLLQEGKE